MASADGDGQEGCANQLTLADCPNVAASGEDIAQGGVDCLPPNIDQEEAAGSKPEVADAQELPESFTIGTPKAFRDGNAYKYKKCMINKETIYVCNKGSRWRRNKEENLVLMCEDGDWTAYDTDVSFDWSTLRCRQPVFRCLETDITRPGKYYWETNHKATQQDAGLETNWQGGPLAETEWP